MPASCAWKRRTKIPSRVPEIRRFGGRRGIVASMLKKVMPASSGSPSRDPIAIGENARCLIFHVGSRQFAIEVKTTIMELSQKPAKVVPIKQKRNRRRCID